MKQRNISLISLLVLALCCAGCSDDSTQPETEFQVIVDVVDLDGNPVPGLNLGILSDNFALQDGQRFFDSELEKASSKIQFYLPLPGHVNISILDIEGRKIRSLYSEDLPAGYESWIWDGEDDQGVHQTSGRYTVKMTVLNAEGELISEKTEHILMALMTRNPVGTTDAKGSVSLTDRRIFPHLYEGLEPMTAKDESGESLGLLELDEAMLFCLFNDDLSQRTIVRRNIPGPGRYSLTVDTTAPAVVTATPSEKRPVDRSSVSSTVDFRLTVFPNPFN
jgi:FlgD Ig-like domain